MLPDAVDFATAAVLTCAGMTAVHATRMSRLASGQTAVVNGIGGVGILVIQAAAHAGATVIAVADSADKAELARAHGAADVIVLAPGDDYATLPDAVRAVAGGRGADVFFELVGTTGTMTAGIRALAPRGRFVSTGYTDQPLEIHPIDFILSETSLVSTVAATRTDLNDAIALAAGRRPGRPAGGPLPAGRYLRCPVRPAQPQRPRPPGPRPELNGAAMADRILIKNGTVVTMNDAGDVHFGGSVAAGRRPDRRRRPGRRGGRPAPRRPRARR